MNHLRPALSVASPWLAAALALGLGGCVRTIEVADAGRPGPTNKPGAGGSGSGLIDDIDQANPGAGGAAGMEPAGAGGVPGGGGGGGGAPDAPPGSDSAAATDATAPDAREKDAGPPPGPPPITDVKVLADSLNAINVPAVGSAGVSLLQYTDAVTAFVLHVDWNGGVSRRHDAAGARYIYTAANGSHTADLLYTATAFAILAGGGASEVSGTPVTYKEFLAANEQGFAWVDYGEVRHMPGVGGSPKPTTLGKIVFQTWTGSRSDLTDASRYRARLDLSRTHVAFVEYASVATGTIGQIVVQPLSGGGPPAFAAPSPRHQDRPAIDGEWVVWEEYLSDNDAVIRARHLGTGEVRNISATTGFRTNPDVLGSRAIWEDQRSGNGDIHFADLGGASGDRVAVSGKGHSTGARLTTDGLVWIESNGGVTGLLRARWAP
jgi:hypothetical protein